MISSSRLKPTGTPVDDVGDACARHAVHRPVLPAIVGGALEHEPAVALLERDAARAFEAQRAPWAP